MFDLQSTSRLKVSLQCFWKYLDTGQCLTISQKILYRNTLQGLFKYPKDVFLRTNRHLNAFIRQKDNLTKMTVTLLLLTNDDTKHCEGNLSEIDHLGSTYGSERPRWPLLQLQMHFT